MQHTSRKGPRAACSQPSWFERDDLHLRDERVERPSFVGVGQKSSCIVSYTAAAAPRRRAFFMGRVLKDFAARKNRLCDASARFTPHKFLRGRDISEKDLRRNLKKASDLCDGLIFVEG